MSILDRFMAVSRLDEHDQFLKGNLYDIGECPPEYTNELFIKKLLKLEPPSDKMRGGIALHSLIEHSVFTTLNIQPQKIYYQGWHIVFEKPVEFYIPTIRELSISRRIGNIPLFGRVDALSGTRVHDLKTTSKNSIETYLNSWQWRAYLWILNYNEFVYNVLVTNTDADNKTIYVIDNYDFMCTRYKGLNEEVEEKVIAYYSTLQLLEDEIIGIAKENNIDLIERVH